MSAATAGDAQTEDSLAAFDGVWLDPDPASLLETAAETMAKVESVRFELDRDGAPVFLDPARALALDHATGRIRVPDAADALLKVVVNGDLNTELGAVAVGEEIWLSNPITGELEPLPAGMDLDPRSFFDPAGAWAPMLVGLTDAELVDDDNDRYHLIAVASGPHLAAVTAGLIGDDDTPIDIWLHPVTGHVTRLEFETQTGTGAASWSVELRDYDAEFEISPPGEEDQ